MRIAVRRTVRNPDDPDTRDLKEPNGRTPLSITIADQHAIRTEDSVDVGQIAQDVEMNASSGCGVEPKMRTRRECSSITNAV